MWPWRLCLSWNKISVFSNVVNANFSVRGSSWYYTNSTDCKASLLFNGQPTNFSQVPVIILMDLTKYNKTSWTKNQVFFLVRFIYSCIYVLFLHAYKKRQSDPINNSCESCSCWELSFWKSSQLLLTTESSLWLPRPCSLNFGSQLHTGSPIECVSHEGFGKVKGFWSTKQKLNQSCCESEFFLPQTLCHCMTFLNTQCAYSTLCMPSGYAKPINTA